MNLVFDYSLLMVIITSVWMVFQTFFILCFGLQISEKQRSLYEALEKQQHYQGSLQSISSKMEALEAKLSEPLEGDKSPDSHIKAHKVCHIQKGLAYCED